jgi:hypothetical protein
MQTEPREDAKRAFVLANRMKAGPFDSVELFQTILAAEGTRVQHLSEVELDAIIARDSVRLTKYNRAVWNLASVQLSRCNVYRHMGDRVWAEGRVHEVAERFKRLEPLTSRIWSMKQFAKLFSEDLPIVILNESNVFTIDDGSHRAVAMYLNRVGQAIAWIGVL